MKWNTKEEHVRKRIEELELDILQTAECKKLDKKMDIIFNKIRRYLPEDKKHLTSDVEDCFTEGLILYEQYFYKNGFMDNNETSKKSSLYERLLSWIDSLKL